MTEKVLSKKGKWTNAVIKEALGFFGLEKGGNQNEIAERMIEFLMSPSSVKEVKGKSTKKRPASSSSSSSSPAKKAKKTTSKKEDKPKRAPSAYILFCQAKRPSVVKENPDASFGELGKLLGEMWKSVTAKEKTKFEVAAKAAAAALASEEGTAKKSTKKKTPVKKSKVEKKEVEEEEGEEEEEEEEAIGWARV